MQQQARQQALRHRQQVLLVKPAEPHSNPAREQLRQRVGTIVISVPVHIRALAEAWAAWVALAEAEAGDGDICHVPYTVQAERRGEGDGGVVPDSGVAAE